VEDIRQTTRQISLILSVLRSSTIPIEGRTAIQKIVYFVSVKSSLDLGYRRHFYGPYSSVVASHLGNLVSMGYVAERQRLTTQNRTIYSYSLTRDGQKLLRSIGKGQEKDYPAIRDVVGKCRRIARNNINTLSCAAKVYFLLSQRMKKATYQEVMRMARRSGWELCPEEIDSGAKLLSTLGLVQKSNVG